MTDRQNKEILFQSLRKDVKIFFSLSNGFDKKEYANSIRDKLIHLVAYEKLFTYEQCKIFDKTCDYFGIKWLMINHRVQVISNFLLHWEEAIKLLDIDLVMDPENVWDIFTLIRDHPNTWGKLLDIESVKAYAAFLSTFPFCYNVDSLEEFKTVIHKNIDDLGIN